MCLCGSGGALVDVGEAMKRMAEVKDSLDIDVKQNFIDPLQGLCDKDLREIQVCASPMFSDGNKLCVSPTVNPPNTVMRYQRLIYHSVIPFIFH